MCLNICIYVWFKTLIDHLSLSVLQPGKQKKKFSSFFKSLVIELDKDLYGPDNHLVEVSSDMANAPYVQRSKPIWRSSFHVFSYCMFLSPETSDLWPYWLEYMQSFSVKRCYSHSSTEGGNVCVLSSNLEFKHTLVKLDLISHTREWEFAFAQPIMLSNHCQLQANKLTNNINT